jgi:hypothetical protein
MGSINVSNSKNRDALVHTQSVSTSLRVRWLDDKGRPAGNVRVVRATLDRDLEALLAARGGDLAAVTEALIHGDPELDLERVGGYLRDTSRVYVSPDQKIVHAVAQWDVVKNPDGSVKERRPHKAAQPNVATETPLRWSGKLMKKSEVWNKFVFAAKLQVVHVNGLTYDFLYEMAKELELKESLLLVGAGPKSNLPLCFQRGGTAYRGFLEGRTQGESYCLILHLSNLELRAPAASEKA